MEEQKQAVLKCFRTLSEEENEDIMQGDTELSFNVKKNGDMSFDDAVENRRSYVILPHEGERMMGHITRTEVGNDSYMTEEERNNINLTEQESVDYKVDNGSEKQTYATNKEQNKTPHERYNAESCHSLHECSLKESVQATCQHISTDCTNTGYDCVAPVDDKKDDNAEVNQRGRKDGENDHSQEDLGGFDHEESARSRSKTRHVVITVTRTESVVEEEDEAIVTPTLEQTVGFKNEDEEEKGAEEDSEEEEEKRDLFPDFSANNLPNPKDFPPNFFTNDPPPGSTFTRATFSPGSPTDKQPQLPALFSGLRVLRKGVVGPEHDTVAQIKPSSSSQGARREVFPERQGDAKAQGSFLDQISQFLNREKRDEKEERKEMEAEGDQDENEIEESQEDERKEPEPESEAEVSFEKPSVSSAEAAFDAFKAFFTPKPLRKDPSEKVDLEAVRRKIRADKDVLKALFERTSNKTPEKKESHDGKVRIVENQH